MGNEDGDGADYATSNDNTSPAQLMTQVDEESAFDDNVGLEA